jgi:hypothetical protein
MERAVRLAICMALATGCLLAASPAFAQEVTGDCRADVNGRSPSALTEDEPLKLRRNERVHVRGQVNGPILDRWTTDFYVVLFGARVPIGSTEGKGGTWGGRVELPGYLKMLTAGTYRIEADAQGKPSLDCSASGYVDLKGGPLTIALGIGALLAGIGAAVALGARGTAANAPDKGTIARKTGIEDRRVKVAPDKLRTRAVDLAFLAALGLAFYLAYEKVLDFGDSLGFALPAGAAAGGPRRVWMHGRIIRGFIGGLLLGAGAALILQQLDVWPLDLTQGLVFPLTVALVSAIRAYLGAAFVVTPPPPEADAFVREPVGVTPGGASAETTALTSPAHARSEVAAETQVIDRRDPDAHAPPPEAGDRPDR